MASDLKKCETRWAAIECAINFYNNVANQLNYDQKPIKELINSIHQSLNDFNLVIKKTQRHLDKFILKQSGNSRAVTFLRGLLNEQHNCRALLIERLKKNIEEITDYTNGYLWHLGHQIEIWKNYSP